jgi:transposase-like protein
MMKMGTEFWAAHVAAARLEETSASEYARQHGLAVKSLYYWRSKLKKSDTTALPLPNSKFVALRIAPGVSQQSNCTLALPSGLRLELSALPTPEWLAALVHAVPVIR